MVNTSTTSAKHPGLREEIEKTVRWFAEMDIQAHRRISESTREMARVQKVELPADAESASDFLK